MCVITYFIFQTEPELWGVEEVCQWLDLVGMGSFKRSFKRKGVSGHMLLHMGVEILGKYLSRDLLLYLAGREGRGGD